MTSVGSETFGLILAGGRGSRMEGASKPFLELGGQVLIDVVVARFSGQCRRLAVSGPPACERLAAHCERQELTLLPDSDAYQGPMAGLLSGLDHCAQHHPSVAFVVTVPVDTPFLPDDLVARLHAGRLAAGATGAMAKSGGIGHPVVALWPVSCRDFLRRRLEQGQRKAAALAQEAGLAVVVIEGAGVDPFFNINTPGNLVVAERLMAAAASGPLVPAPRPG